MVRLLLIVLFTCMGLVSGAQQLANSGFESWTTTNGYQVPSAPWVVINEYLPGEFVVTGTKSTDKRSGSFAVALSPYDNVNEIYNPTLLETQGPFTALAGKPYSFEGYYKFTPANTDAVSISVEVAQSSSVLGSGMISISDAVSSYTKFVVPINYTNNSLTPNEVWVKFTMVNNQTTEGTVFLLDDVAFGYTPIASVADNVNTTEGLVVNSNEVKFTDADSKGLFEVTDMMGKALLNIDETNAVNFTDLPSGTYLVKISTKSGRNQIVKVIH